MLRNFALPAIAVGVMTYGIVGYGGYRPLQLTTDAQVEMEPAL